MKEKPSFEKKEKPLNYFLAEADGGLWNVGTTEDEAGYYEPEQGTNDAPSWIAPNEYVHAWLKEHGEDESDDAVRQAIKQYIKEQKL